MGITSFGASGGKYDELFKKSLVPKSTWSDDSAWVSDANAYVNGRTIGLIPINPTAQVSQPSANANIGIGTLHRGTTFTTGASSFYAVSVDLSLYKGSSTADFEIYLMGQKADGTPDFNNIISKEIIPASTFPADNIMRDYSFTFSNYPKLSANTGYAIILYSSVNGYVFHGYNAEVDANFGYGYSTDNGETWTSQSYELKVAINGSSTFPTEGVSYADFAIKNSAVELDKFSFTTETDGTNSIKVDILDTNNNMVMENINSDTSLYDLGYDTVRIRSTLTSNGSNIKPEVRDYGLVHYVKGNHRELNEKMYVGSIATANEATLTEVLNIQGSCKLKLLSLTGENATYDDHSLEVYVDGDLVYKASTTSNPSGIGIYTPGTVSHEAGAFRMLTYQGYNNGLANANLTTLPYTGNSSYWSLIETPIECKNSLVINAGSYNTSYPARYIIVTEV